MLTILSTLSHLSGRGRAFVLVPVILWGCTSASAPVGEPAFDFADGPTIQVKQDETTQLLLEEAQAYLGGSLFSTPQGSGYVVDIGGISHVGVGDVQVLEAPLNSVDNDQVDGLVLTAHDNSGSVQRSLTIYQPVPGEADLFVRETSDNLDVTTNAYGIQAGAEERLAEAFATSWNVDAVEAGSSRVATELLNIVSERPYAVSMASMRQARATFRAYGSRVLALSADVGGEIQHLVQADDLLPNQYWSAAVSVASTAVWFEVAYLASGTYGVHERACDRDPTDPMCKFGIILGYDGFVGDPEDELEQGAYTETCTLTAPLEINYVLVWTGEYAEVYFTGGPLVWDPEKKGVRDGFPLPIGRDPYDPAAEECPAGTMVSSEVGGFGTGTGSTPSAAKDDARTKAFSDLETNRLVIEKQSPFRADLTPGKTCVYKVAGSNALLSGIDCE